MIFLAKVIFFVLLPDSISGKLHTKKPRIPRKRSIDYQSTTTVKPCYSMCSPRDYICMVTYPPCQATTTPMRPSSTRSENEDNDDDYGSEGDYGDANGSTTTKNPCYITVCNPRDISCMIAYIPCVQPTIPSTRPYPSYTPRYTETPRYPASTTPSPWTPTIPCQGICNPRDYMCHIMHSYCMETTTPNPPPPTSSISWQYYPFQTETTTKPSPLESTTYVPYSQPNPCLPSHNPRDYAYWDTHTFPPCTYATSSTPALPDYGSDGDYCSDGDYDDFGSSSTPAPYPCALPHDPTDFDYWLTHTYPPCWFATTAAPTPAVDPCHPNVPPHDYQFWATWTPPPGCTTPAPYTPAPTPPYVYGTTTA